VPGGDRARRDRGTERRLVRWLDDLGVRGDGSLEDGVDVVGDDVDGARSGPHLAVDAAGVLGRAKRDCAAGGPAQLGVDGAPSSSSTAIAARRPNASTRNRSAAAVSS
jgi:hypothetical protein